MNRFEEIKQKNIDELAELVKTGRTFAWLK